MTTKTRKNLFGLIAMCLILAMIAMFAVGIFRTDAKNVAHAATEYYYAYTGAGMVGNIQDKQTAYVYMGSEYGMPIKWRILSNDSLIDEPLGTTGGIMLFADDIVGANQYYNDTGSNLNAFWYVSKIRSYLNGYSEYADNGIIKAFNTNYSFINLYFTSSERAAMIDTVINTVGFRTANNVLQMSGFYPTDPSVTFSDQDGSADVSNGILETTTDKLFLLDYNDVFNTDYGFAPHNLGASFDGELSGYYYKNPPDGVFTDYNGTDDPGMAVVSDKYWLRPTGTGTSDAHTLLVNNGGWIGIAKGQDNMLGVRPAFNLDPDCVVLTTASAGATALTGNWKSYKTTSPIATAPEYKLYLKDTSVCTGVMSSVAYDNGNIVVEYTKNNAAKLTVALADNASGKIVYTTTVDADNSGESIIPVLPYAELGTYTATAFLHTNNGGNASEYTSAPIMSSIDASRIPMPEAVTNAVYNGAEITLGSLIGNDYAISSYATYVVPTGSVTGYTNNVGKATDAGKYRTMLTLNDASYAWEDGTTADIEILWEILPKPASDPDIAVNGAVTQTYTGSAIEPIIVKDGSTVLVDGTDYDIVYTDNINAGTASYVITFKGNYTGTLNGTFTIEPSSNASIEGDNNQTYTGSDIEPIIVKDGSTVLVDGTDYDIVYTDNINAGTASYAVTLKGNYTGTLNGTFTIDPSSNASIEGDNNQTYTGSEIEPLIVKDGAIVLVEGTDYDIVYTDNVNVGTAGYTVTFKGNYVGSLSGDFMISPKVVSSFADVNVEGDTDKTYTGSGIAPIIINDGIMLLVEGTDYDIAYTDNIDAGTASYVVTFKGNYTGALNGTFTINPKELTVVWSNLSFVYDGTEKLPTASVDTGITGIDCILTVTGAATEIGTYTAQATTTDTNFVLADDSIEYEIEPKDLTSAATVEGEGTYTYTGSEIESLIVKDGAIVLVEGTDYDIVYTDNVNVGTAGYTVTFKGNYVGSLSGDFMISPKVVSSFADVNVEGDTDKTYTGSGIAPIIINDGITLLVDGTDYDIAYTDNVDAGTANYEITFKGNYTGTLNGTFAINPKELTVTWSNLSFVYDGTEKLPTATVDTGIPGIDCTITVTGAATEIGTYTAQATTTEANFVLIGATVEFEIASNATPTSTPTATPTDAPTATATAAATDNPDDSDAFAMKRNVLMILLIVTIATGAVFLIILIIVISLKKQKKSVTGLAISLLLVGIVLVVELVVFFVAGANAPTVNPEPTSSVVATVNSSATQTDDSSASATVAPNVNGSAELLNAEGFTLDDETNTLTCNVPYSTEYIAFADVIKVSENATCGIYTDEACTNRVVSATVYLIMGDNTVYLKIVSGDETVSKTYKVIINRNLAYTVTFETLGGTPIPTQMIETGALVTAPSVTPERNGYDFDGWDFDFTTPITSDTVITANWNLITYNITYVLPDGVDNNVSNPSTYTIESDAITLAPVIRDGFDFLGWKNGVEYVTEIPSGSFGEITLVGEWEELYLSLTMKADGTYEVERLLDYTRQHVDIKDSYNGIPVTSIGVQAFYVARELRSVTIGNNVTEIGYQAFLACEHLMTVVLGENVTTLEYNSFEECIKLVEIWNKSSLTVELGSYTNGQIGMYARRVYVGDDFETYLSEADGFTYYTDGALKLLVDISNEITGELIIPEGVTEIGVYAGGPNDKITKIIIPDTVEVIGNNAFIGSINVYHVTIGANVNTIDYAAFGMMYIYEIYNRSSLPIVAGDNMNYGEIGAYAVEVYTGDSFVSGLKVTDKYVTHTRGNVVTLCRYNVGIETDIVLPSGITQIHMYAIIGYMGNNVNSVTIPDSVTVIRAGAFAFYSNKPQYVYFENTVGWSVDNGAGGVTAIDSTALQNAATAAAYVTTDYYAYDWTRTVTYNVTFVTNCDATVSPQIVQAGAYATVPSETLEKSGYEFAGWDYDFTAPITSDTVITANWNLITYTITYELGEGWVNNHPDNPSTYTVEDNVILYPATKNLSIFVEWQKDGTAITEIPAGTTGNITLTAVWSLPDVTFSLKSDGTYEITGPNYSNKKNIVILAEYNGIAVTSIGDNAFNNYDELESIVIPDSVTSIGTQAFSFCDNLTSIVLPQNVTAIGKMTFFGCTALTSITLPANLTSIGEMAFAYCPALETITLPASLTSIGANAFNNCVHLTDVTFETTTGWSVTDSLLATTAIPSADLESASTAATYLTTTYTEYSWTKE